MGDRVGRRLLEIANQAEALLANRAQPILQRIEVPAEQVVQTVRQHLFRDQFTSGANPFHKALAGDDFNQRYQETAVDRTSFRAGEAQRVAQAYESFKAAYHRDSFDPQPVTMKASDLQRVYIRA
jgi:hypothetical protein